MIHSSIPLVCGAAVLDERRGFLLPENVERA